MSTRRGKGGKPVRGGAPVVVLADVDGVFRGVLADGGGDGQGLFDALEHLAVVLHNTHNEERGGGHPVWTSKHRGRRG